MLARDGSDYISREPLPESDLGAALAKTRQTLAGVPDALELCRPLLCVAGSNLARSSRVRWTRVFPGGSFETAEFLYQNVGAAALLQRDTADVRWNRSRNTAAASLRVLEVGAGTGGTTASALPALSGVDAEYWFTDLSDLFLARAGRKFSDYPFVRYRRIRS